MKIISSEQGGGWWWWTEESVECIYICKCLDVLNSERVLEALLILLWKNEHFAA